MNNVGDSIRFLSGLHMMSESSITTKLSTSKVSILTPGVSETGCKSRPIRSGSVQDESINNRATLAICKERRTFFNMGAKVKEFIKDTEAKRKEQKRGLFCKNRIFKHRLIIEIIVGINVFFR